VGDQDQFVHLWRYAGGYANIDENIRYRRLKSVLQIQIKFNPETGTRIQIQIQAIEKQISLTWARKIYKLKTSAGDPDPEPACFCSSRIPIR
jgi:hypothetical protein